MYRSNARVLCIIGLCFWSVESAKILMAPWPMPSHVSQFATMDSELKKLGHQVDHLLPETFPPGLQKQHAKGKTTLNLDNVKITIIDYKKQRFAYQSFDG
mgnify:CR=1 FL=1